MAEKDRGWFLHQRLAVYELTRVAAESIRLIREADLYENDLYFVSQMFEDNWQPREMKIDYDCGTIHGGPVKKYYTEPEKN